MLDLDSDFWEDLEERRVKASVAAKAWVTVGLAWRSPDVSESMDIQDDADWNLAVRCLPPVAILRRPHRKTGSPGIYYTWDGCAGEEETLNSWK